MFWNVFVELKLIIFPFLHVNVLILVNAKAELIQLKFVIAVKLDKKFTIDVFMKVVKSYYNLNISYLYK